MIYAQAVPQVGQRVASGLTIPYGGAWINGNLGGHFWQGDNALGVCRIDNGVVSTVPNACSTTAKAGGQLVVADPTAGLNLGNIPAGNAKLLFVSDASSKSNQVVRFLIDTRTEIISSTLVINVVPPTNVGGGTNGARAVGIALAPNKKDLYVGYIKSGDIMIIPNATGTTSGSPPGVAKIGSTSDGKGINSMTLFGNDLYLAELGGTTPLSYIQDPSGLTRAPCTSSSPCSAKAPPGLPNGLPPNPAGLTTDANVSPTPAAPSLYLGDSPLNGTPGIGIVKWTPSTNTVSTYSTEINPPYDGNDGTRVNHYTTYVNPTGLAFAPNGDLYVGDDPSFRCAAPACAAPPTNQGHLWKVSPAPAAPTVTGISPTSGSPAGGTVVTITGTGFSTAAGATTVSFGPGTPATAVSCSSNKTCTATSPAGLANTTVAVTVTVGGQTSATSAADQFVYQNVTVASISPISGPVTGGTVVTITGTGFSTTSGAVTVSFGSIAPVAAACSSSTSCTTTSPAGVAGAVDIVVHVTTGTTTDSSPVIAADTFTYIANTTPFITSLCVVTDPRNPTGPCSGSTGIAVGGTMVRLTGGNLSKDIPPGFVNFGANAGSVVSCASDGTTCTVISPPSPIGAGVVPVRYTVGTQSSVPVNFTYANPSATVWAFGITAPKGGMLWVPGALGGHWWSSDHANGFCRQDAISGGAPFAMNYAICDDGSIGSPGQAVYDPTTNPDGTHYIYVPDNAVKSTAVWRLTFNPTIEKIQGPPEAMIPLADVRTLKPNGMALGPGPNGPALYVTDLTEANIRRIDGPAGDPRLQTLTIIGTTGDGRGANGTVGFIGNKLYISENRQASWMDVTQCTDNTTRPCQASLNPAAPTSSDSAGWTGSVPLPGGVFIAGVTTDPVHNLVYAADSPGGAAATIWRYNPVTNATASVVYIQQGVAPNPGPSFNAAQTATRPTDGIATSTTFSFVFGLAVDPANGNLMITEDFTAGNRSGRGRAWVSPFIP